MQGKGVDLKGSTYDDMGIGILTPTKARGGINIRNFPQFSKVFWLSDGEKMGTNLESHGSGRGSNGVKNFL